MVHTFERPRGRVGFLALAVLYWLSVFLLSLTAAASLTPDLLVPVMLVLGLPLLVCISRFTLREANLTDRALAYTDDLTSLGNRRSFRLRAGDLLNGAEGGSVALVLVDVDGLKRLNDACGHQAGDEMLIQVGDCLATAADTCADVFRFGGDEFAILIDRMHGGPVAEIVGGLDGFDAKFKSCSHEHHITMSYGFVTNLAGECLDALFQRADQRLRDFKSRRERLSDQAEALDYNPADEGSVGIATSEATKNIASLEERRLARRTG